MIKIFNTGGTFNKRYDPVEGRLVVPEDDEAIGAIVSRMPAWRVSVEGLIYKDSLQMDKEDRHRLAKKVVTADALRIVVVHGTDTMRESAAVVAEWLGAKHDKRVVFTGAMVPFSIDPIEATAHLSMAIASVDCLHPGVYIAMHGFVLPWDHVVKNKVLGRFERMVR